MTKEIKQLRIVKPKHEQAVHTRLNLKDPNASVPIEFPDELLKRIIDQLPPHEQVETLANLPHLRAYNNSKVSYLVFLFEGEDLEDSFKHDHQSSDVTYVNFPFMNQFETFGFLERKALGEKLEPLCERYKSLSDTYQNHVLILQFGFDLHNESVYRTANFYTFIYQHFARIRHKVEVLKQGCPIVKLTKTRDRTVGLFEYNRCITMGFNETTKTIEIDTNEVLCQLEEGTLIRGSPLFEHLPPSTKENILSVSNKDLLDISVVCHPGRSSPSTPSVSTSSSSSSDADSDGQPTAREEIVRKDERTSRFKHCNTALDNIHGQLESDTSTKRQIRSVFYSKFHKCQTEEFLDYQFTQYMKQQILNVDFNYFQRIEEEMIQRQLRPRHDDDDEDDLPRQHIKMVEYFDVRESMIHQSYMQFTRGPYFLEYLFARATFRDPNRRTYLMSPECSLAPSPFNKRGTYGLLSDYATSFEANRGTCNALNDILDYAQTKHTHLFEEGTHALKTKFKIILVHSYMGKNEQELTQLVKESNALIWNFAAKIEGFSNMVIETNLRQLLSANNDHEEPPAATYRGRLEARMVLN